MSYSPRSKIDNTHLAELTIVHLPALFELRDLILKPIEHRLALLLPLSRILRSKVVSVALNRG
jgi:hypothetical protein